MNEPTQPTQEPKVVQMNPQHEASESTTQEKPKSEEEKLQGLNHIDQSLNGVRALSNLLLESAMNYREAHWREDIDIAYTSEMNNPKLKGLSRGTKRHNEKLINDRKEKRTSVSNQLNQMVYKAIKEVKENLTDEAKKHFSNTAAFFGLLAEEAMIAKDHAQFLMLAKMYNAGQFNDMFTALENHKEDAKHDYTQYEKEKPNADATPNNEPTDNERRPSVDTDEQKGDGGENGGSGDSNHIGTD